MLRRLALAVAGILLLASAIPAQRSQPARFVSRLAWSMDDPAFGGWSGLEVLEDGTGFVVLSDRGRIMGGRLLRDEAGRIAGIQAGSIRRLGHTDGGPLPKYRDDAEGLAMTPDGRVFISFEAEHRVDAYADARAAKAEPLPLPPLFKGIRNNSSLEALAVGPDGTLYTIPERSGAYGRPFPVYRFRDGAWDQPFAVPRRDDFLVVGADVGPDGRLYVLERVFKGIFGFGTRVRRFEIGAAWLGDETVLLETPAGTHDNLEGLGVWRDADGQIRLTMISDNNFRFFQTTEFVEYAVAE